MLCKSDKPSIIIIIMLLTIQACLWLTSNNGRAFENAWEPIYKCVGVHAKQWSVSVLLNGMCYISTHQGLLQLLVDMCNALHGVG